MSRLPDGIVGKALALGLCLVTAGAVHLAVVAPLLAAYDRSANAVQERRAMVQRLQRAVASLPALRASAERTRQEAASGDLLLPESSDDVAAAALQAAVKDLLKRTGASLTSAEIMPPKPTNEFQKIRLRISFTADLELLATVLRTMEESRPLILVDNLDIQTAAARGTQGAHGASPSLVIGLEISGLRPA